jgi:hypothetical protein
MRLYLLIGVLGLVLGIFLQVRVETQAPGLLFARDSASNTAVVVQTNGSNALKVVGK